MELPLVDDTDMERVLPGVPTTKGRTSDSVLTILEHVPEPFRAFPIAFDPVRHCENRV